MNEYIFMVNKPVVFKNILKEDNETCKNSCIKWNPQILADLLDKRTLEFRIGNVDFDQNRGENSNPSF